MRVILKQTKTNEILKEISKQTKINLIDKKFRGFGCLELDVVCKNNSRILVRFFEDTLWLDSEYVYKYIASN